MCDIDAENGSIAIVYQVLGDSTRRMAQMEPGDYFHDVVCPLGRPSELVEMSDEELKENPAVEQEWDIQWEIFRLLAECEERDIELIKGLRADLREAGESNIGIIFQQ